MRIRNTRLIAAGAAAAIAVGATGMVFAQDPGATDPGSSTVEREHRPGRVIRAVIGVRQIIGASGLDPALFREGFHNGQSINQVLEANGVDSAAVQAIVLSNVEAHLAERVAADDLDQARADEILAKAPERLGTLLDHVPDGDHAGHPFVRERFRLGLLDSAAETIGVTIRELVTEVRDSDGTIATVAEAHGVDPQAVIDNAVTRATARIDEAAANGRITPEKAEELKANLPARITELVNTNPPRERD